MLVIAKIINSELTFPQDEVLNIFMKERSVSPTMKISSVFKNFNRSHGKFYFRVANTKEQLLKDIKKGKGTFIQDANLKVDHGVQDTDIDTWVQDDVYVLSKHDKDLDLKEIINNNNGKFVCFSFKSN